MNNSEVIKKLLAVAEKQQKIIVKLAQAAGLSTGLPDDEQMSSGVVNVVENTKMYLEANPAAKGCEIVSAKVKKNDGSFSCMLRCPDGLGKDYTGVQRRLVEDVKGETLNADMPANEKVRVSNDPLKVLVKLIK